MAEHDYDLFVIGAGSGGVRAARIAAGYGARVAIAEEYRVGGTCVIRGCVPKKLFVYASKFPEEFEAAGGFGWTVGEPSFDWKTLIANKDREIDRLNGVYIGNLDRSGVEILQTRAEVVDPHTVRLLGEDRTITADRILIAVGATPFLDDTVSGIEHVITSNEAFHLETFPQSIVVCGGGYIAVEFAAIFAGLGAKTTLLYRGEEILRGFDMDLRRYLHEEMTRKGIDVVTGDRFVSIEKRQDGLVGTLETGGTIAADQIMYAIGRRPKTESLGLENAGVKLNRSGAVVVDDRSCSNVPSIFAVGDVTDRVNLTPVAIREGHAFADTVFGDKPTTVDHSNIPTAVFSQPEIGTVGLSEDEARDLYPAVDIYKTRFRPMKATLGGGEDRIFMKIVVDAKTDKVLGVHLMGHDSGELIQVLGVAVKMGATKAQFDATVAVHPTAAEELVTMREPSERHRREEDPHVPVSVVPEIPAIGDAIGTARAGHAGRIFDDIAVRMARDSDRAILSQVGLHAFQAAIGPYVLGQTWNHVRDNKPFDQMIAEQEEHILVAVFEGEPVGFALLGDEPCLLSDIWVAPLAWSRGVGTILLSVMEEYARMRGCEEMSLRVFAENRRAIRFFSRRGFQEVSRGTWHHRIAATDLSMISMVKALKTA